jgi:YVTN family beta-propeller protein
MRSLLEEPMLGTSTRPAVTWSRHAWLRTGGPVSLALAALSIAASASAQPDAVLETGGKLYVTSWFENSVSAVDLRNRAVETTIPVGTQDHNVFLSPDRTTAWVANNNDGTVSIIDVATNTVAHVLQVGNGPRHTYFAPDGREAYVTLEFDHAVAVIDPTSRERLATIPVGHMPHFPIAVGNKLFVTNFGTADVTVIDRTRRQVIGSVGAGLGPLGAGATRDGKRLYVACHASNHVAVIDVEGLTLIARIPTDAGPVQVSVTPDQKFAYVTNDGRGTVQKIDLATNQVVETIVIGPGAGTHGIAFDAQRSLLFVTNMGTDTVAVIDMNLDEVIAEIPVGIAPEGIAYLP